MDRHIAVATGLASMVDVDQLQRMQNQFSEATDLAIIAVDLKGTPVTRAHGFTDFCAVMRLDPKRRKLCYSCDAHGGLQAAIEGRPQIYRCHAGIVDFSVPITVGGQYVGAVLCGQVQLAERNARPEYVLPSDDSWRANRRLLPLLDEVPIASMRKMRAAAETLHGLAGEIARIETGHHLLPPSPPTPGPPAVAPPAPAPAPRAEPADADALDVAPLRQALDADDLVAAHASVTAHLDRLFADAAAAGWPRLEPAEDQLARLADEYCTARQRGLGQLVARRRAREVGQVNRYRAQVHLEGLLNALFSAASENRPRRPRDLHDLLNHIEANKARALTLGAAAEFLCVSPSHLSKRFRAVTGSNFIAYVTEKRVERAKMMLAFTEMPVLRIAVELDFHQVNYFSRVFKSYAGISPTEYRSKHRGASRGGCTRADVPALDHDPLGA